MERHNWGFNSLLACPSHGLFVFCERVREEERRWEKRHENALKGNFTNWQRRKELQWPDVPTDFDDWTAKKKRQSKQAVTSASILIIKGLMHRNVLGRVSATCMPFYVREVYIYNASMYITLHRMTAPSQGKAILSVIL